MTLFAAFFCGRTRQPEPINDKKIKLIRTDNFMGIDFCVKNA